MVSRKTTTLNFPKALYRRLKPIARKERRSVTGLVVFIVEKYLEEQEKSVKVRSC